MKTKILLLGAGGYAKSVLDSLDMRYFDPIGFIDEYRSLSEEHLGLPILANHISDIIYPFKYKYFISIGDNISRRKKFNIIKRKGLELISVIDKTSLISKNTSLGEGNFFGKLSIINSGVKIGNNNIINTKALVEHGCIITDHCNISTNVTLNGDVKVMKNSFIGSSAVINGQLTIGKNSIIGSGSVVISNVANNNVVVGVPAKFIRSNSED